jgi:hypothetical protein
MTTVFAQVGGDAVGASADGHLRSAQRIGVAPAAGVADGGHVIDVDAQAEMTLGLNPRDGLTGHCHCAAQP